MDYKESLEKFSLLMESIDLSNAYKFKKYPIGRDTLYEFKNNGGDTIAVFFKNKGKGNSQFHNNLEEKGVNPKGLKYFELSFGKSVDDDDYDERKAEYALTKAGDARTVLTTVTSTVADFLKKNKGNVVIGFAGDDAGKKKDSGQRMRVYMKMQERAFKQIPALKNFAFTDMTSDDDGEWAVIHKK